MQRYDNFRQMSRKEHYFLLTMNLLAAEHRGINGKSDFQIVASDGELTHAEAVSKVSEVSKTAQTTSERCTEKDSPIASIS
jgi:hypothetical protein